jgi:hypothetical protein
VQMQYFKDTAKTVELPVSINKIRRWMISVIWLASRQSRVVRGGGTNSMATVRKRTIPTERPPLVSEVSANFLRIEGATWSA